MEKLTKSFTSLRGEKFNPIGLYYELSAGLPSELSLFKDQWMNCVKFCTQCEFAEPNFNRHTVPASVAKVVDRAIASIPTKLFPEIYFGSWISRISHPSDWKLMRYLEKQDLDAIFFDLLPLVYVSIFVELRKVQYNWHPGSLRESILSYLFDLLDENGIFTISAYDDGKSLEAAAKIIVWWIHDPVVKEIFHQAREEFAQFKSVNDSIRAARFILASLAKCAMSTRVTWMPDLRDE